MCWACRIRYDRHGIALPTLLTALQYSISTVVSWFVTMELVSPWDEESARTLGVLDVDEWKERFHVKSLRNNTVR